MSQFCHNCGTKLPDDAIFCSGCGTRVKMAEQPTQVVNVNNIEMVQPIAETATTLEQERPSENVSYSSQAEPPKAEENIMYSTPAEPPRAEENVSYSNPAEPPKAEENIMYSAPAEPTRAEENVSYSNPVEPLKAEENIMYSASVQSTESNSYTGGNSYMGENAYGNSMSSAPQMSSVPKEQPIPGFGAPGGKINKKNKPKKKKTWLIVGFVMVLLLAAGAVTVWFLEQQGILNIFEKEDTSTYKEAIDLYVKGIEEQEIDTFLDAYGSFLVEEFTDGSGQEFIEEIYEEYESEAGSDLKIKYEVTKEKEYSESKLEKLQEDLEEDYDFKGTLEKAYDITTEFTIEGEDGEIDDRVKFLVVEIEGQWYLAEFDN